MKTKFGSSKLIKWIPVALAAIIAAATQIQEQKEEERIDDIEARIEELEKKGEA